MRSCEVWSFYGGTRKSASRANNPISNSKVWSKLLADKSRRHLFPPRSMHKSPLAYLALARPISRTRTSENMWRRTLWGSSRGFSFPYGRTLGNLYFSLRVFWLNSTGTECLSGYQWRTPRKTKIQPLMLRRRIVLWVIFQSRIVYQGRRRMRQIIILRQGVGSGFSGRGLGGQTYANLISYFVKSLGVSLGKNRSFPVSSSLIQPTLYSLQLW